ncbi:MAG: DUF4317 domain-containing protein [Ruminococcus sp.]|nr:DUF4317 domain-containing protein [Ruminococcus sp.]MCM1382514.1 DUF4317 domain-containing protein [Muribaculaceae bacterium]
MNKKEVAEIKKNFTDSSGFFTLNHIISAYIDPEKNVRCKDSKLYALIPEDEGAVMLETMKKVLGGRVGKNLVEYGFPREEYEEDGAQNVLYGALKGKLEDEVANDKLLARIVNNMEYEQAYTLIIGCCSYSVMTRDKNDENIGEGADEYNFIVAAVCPVCTGDDGLMFDSEACAIVKKANTDLIVSRAPTDGFLYPVFSDRAPDVNNVMYYTKTPKKPNISVVEDVLGCEWTMSCQREKETFQQVLTDVVADELSYTVITQVNEAIRDIVNNSKNETELPLIDDNKLHNILFDAGVSSEKLDALPAVFKEKVGEAEGLTAENLVENKVVLATPEITINISREAADKVRTSVIGGRRCLVIDLDDPSISVNGLTTSVE